jgi:hypothetical protein
MTEIEILRRRRELVVLSAELQRATIARRLDRLHVNPARRALGYAAKVASRPALWKLGTAAVGMALRVYRRRAASKARHQQRSIS